MTESARRTLLRFAPMIYGPSVLFALGEGAIVPLIPVVASQLGADLALSGLIASAIVVGQLAGNLPAGWFVARFGERLTMAGASAVALVGVVGLALAPSLVLLTAAVFLIGLCAAAFGLARHAFMATKVPEVYRARSLAMLGGAFRLGMFAGPLIAALLLSLTGAEASAAWFFAACLVGTALLVLLGPDPEARVSVSTVPRGGGTARDPRAEQPPDTGAPITGGIVLPGDGPDGVFRAMARHRDVLARLGVAAAALSAVRAARQVVLPVWGVSLGLDAPTISLVFGIAGGVEFALFYSSGQIMDRFGRLWASVPPTIIMGLAFVILAFTHDLSSAAVWFVTIATVLGIGNGLSVGLLLTLGVDTAPRSDPAPYLSSWRTLTDAGGAIAPVLFSGVAAISTLGIATGVIGVIGLLGALGFGRWVPRFAQGRGGRGNPKG